MMWSRCWWATWLSGFFGIAGIAHVARVTWRLRLVIGEAEIPLWVSAAVGASFLLISAGLLWIEVLRARGKHRG